MLASVAAEGLDLDQLRSRSAFSEAAGVVSDLLWLPHDVAVRSIPNAWITGSRAVTPALIAGNSLLWGAVTYLLLVLWRGRRSR